MLRDDLKCTISDAEFLANTIPNGKYLGRLDISLTKTSEHDECIVGTLGLILIVKDEESTRRMDFVLNPGKANLKRRAEKDAKMLGKWAEIADVEPLKADEWENFIHELNELQQYRKEMLLFEVYGPERDGEPIRVVDVTTDIKRRLSPAERMSADQEIDETANPTLLKLLANDAAIPDFRDVLENYARERTGAYMSAAEAKIKRQCRRGRVREIYRQDIEAAIVAMHKLISTDGFAYPSLSVHPGDLYSGIHVGDILRLHSWQPLLWREIVSAGVECGALLFSNSLAEAPEIAVVRSNPDWQGNFKTVTIRCDSGGGIKPCRAAINQSYPPTLPDPAHWGGSGR